MIIPAVSLPAMRSSDFSMIWMEGLRSRKRKSLWSRCNTSGPASVMMSSTCTHTSIPTFRKEGSKTTYPLVGQILRGTREVSVNDADSMQHLQGQGADLAEGRAQIHQCHCL